MTTRIYLDYHTFVLRDNQEDNGVSDEFARDNPKWERMNRTNTGCWDCYRCVCCEDCITCYECSYCDTCTNLKSRHCWLAVNCKRPVEALVKYVNLLYK